MHIGGPRLDTMPYRSVRPPFAKIMQNRPPYSTVMGPIGAMMDPSLYKMPQYKQQPPIPQGQTIRHHLNARLVRIGWVWEKAITLR